jgi:putative ABC transport system permease protein
VALVLGSALKLSALGILIGTLVALAAGRLISAWLNGVQSYDIPTMACVSLGLLLVSVIACYVPAARATRIDPLMALRQE